VGRVGWAAAGLFGGAMQHFGSGGAIEILSKPLALRVRLDGECDLLLEEILI
jgi:uncharacterized protein involved in copper resistance